MTHTHEGRDLVFARLWQSVGWLMVAAVVALTLVPQPPEVPLVTSDKAQHLLGYATLMFWFRQAFTAPVRWAVVLAALGVALEFIQGWQGQRQFEYADMLANAAGIGFGLLLAASPLGSLVPALDRAVESWVRERADS